MDFIRLVTWLGIEGLARKRMWRLKNFMDFFFLWLFLEQGSSTRCCTL